MTRRQAAEMARYLKYGHGYDFAEYEPGPSVADLIVTGATCIGFFVFLGILTYSLLAYGAVQ